MKQMKPPKPIAPTRPKKMYKDASEAEGQNEESNSEQVKSGGEGKEDEDVQPAPEGALRKLKGPKEKP